MLTAEVVKALKGHTKWRAKSVAPGATVWVCRHGHLFVMDELAAFTRWEFDIYARRGERLRRLRCHCCGTRHPDLRLSAPSGYDSRGHRDGRGDVGLAV